MKDKLKKLLDDHGVIFTDQLLEDLIDLFKNPPIELDFFYLNSQLMAKDEERAEKIIHYSQIDSQYVQEMDKASSSAMGASQQIRDAQARKVLNTDNPELVEDWRGTGLDVKLLNNRVAVLIAISANLRTMEFKKEKENY